VPAVRVNRLECLTPGRPSGLDGQAHATLLLQTVELLCWRIHCTRGSPAQSCTQRCWVSCPPPHMLTWCCAELHIAPCFWLVHLHLPLGRPHKVVPWLISWLLHIALLLYRPGHIPVNTGEVDPPPVTCRASTTPAFAGMLQVLHTV
jgi:hypothetical protein